MMKRLLLFLLPLFFVLIIPPAYSESFDLRQGTLECNAELKDSDDDGIPNTRTLDCKPQSSSHLEICVEYIDGTDCYDSQKTLTSFTQIPFTFFDGETELRTLIKATVSPKTDYSKMYDIYCIQEPSWTATQVITINGIEYELSKHIGIGDTFDQNTQIHTGSPLQFTPSLIPRLLDMQGVDLKTGDKFTWTTHWRAGFFVVEGTLEDPDGDGIGSCDELDDVHNIAVGFDAVNVGQSTQMEFVWIDPLDVLGGVDDPRLIDTDNDGISDFDDKCDFSPEVFNGFNDNDGCPDQVLIGSLPDPDVDTDGDGIKDEVDVCDTQSETFNGFQDHDGCPDVDPPANIVDDQDPNFCTKCNEVYDVDAKICYVLGAPCDTTNDTTVNVDTDKEIPVIDDGSSFYCNNSVHPDCEQIILEWENSRSGTGIKLPFEPTIFNLMLVFGLISAVIILVVVFRKK